MIGSYAGSYQLSFLIGSHVGSYQLCLPDRILCRTLPTLLPNRILSTSLWYIILLESCVGSLKNTRSYKILAGFSTRVTAYCLPAFACTKISVSLQSNLNCFLFKPKSEQVSLNVQFACCKTDLHRKFDDIIV